MAIQNGDQNPEKIERPMTNKIPYWRLVVDQGVLTQEIIDYPYKGSGTEESPYEVVWIENDPRNPMTWTQLRKWTLTMTVAISTLAVALVSSAYTGGVREIEAEFHIGSEVATLGVSLFVLGFAIGELFSVLYEEYLSDANTAHRTSALGASE
jgi:hypothetical protein